MKLGSVRRIVTLNTTSGNRDKALPSVEEKLPKVNLLVDTIVCRQVARSVLTQKRTHYTISIPNIECRVGSVTCVAAKLLCSTLTSALSLHALTVH